MRPSLHSCPVICQIQIRDPSYKSVSRNFRQKRKYSRRDTLMTDAQTKTEKGPSLREINQPPWGKETLFTNLDW